jgi:hypothetical protein
MRATLLAALCCAALVPPAAGAAAQKAACTMISRADVEHVLGWHVDTVEDKRYDMLGRTGDMCFFEAHDGVVTVTVPDPGSAFPGMTAYNTPDTSLVQTVPMQGAAVAIYNSTVYVSRHGKDVSVKVTGNDRVASYADVQPFAKIVVRKLK